LVSAARGDRLRDLVLSALEFRRIGNGSDDMIRVMRLMEEALRTIGRKSRVNALRIEKYGVSIPTDPRRNVPAMPDQAEG